MSKISSSDLVSGLSDSKLVKHGDVSMLSNNTIRAVALVAATMLTGCASPGMQSVTQHAEQNYQTPQLKVIDAQNYKSVIDNAESGLYVNPLYPDRLMAMEFSHDGNAESKIKHDLENNGISTTAYDWNKGIFNINQPEGAYTSMHIQDPMDFAHGDINFTYINTKARLMPSDDPQYEMMQAVIYYLVMHEAGHSVDHQQLSLLDQMTIPFDKSDIFYLENSSDVIGLLKTVQMLAENDKGTEFIAEFINAEEGMRKSELMTYSEKDDLYSGYNPSHRSVQAIHMVRDMVENDLEKVVNLTNEQIIDIAEVIGKHSLEHDFKDDFINDIMNHDNNGSRINSEYELGTVTNGFLNLLVRPIPGVPEETRFEFNSQMILSAAEKSGVESFVEIANEIGNNPEDYYYDYKDNPDKAIRSVLENVIYELKLSDVEQQRMISYISGFDGFQKDVYQQLDEQGLWKANSMENSYTVTEQKVSIPYGM